MTSPLFSTIQPWLEFSLDDRDLAWRRSQTMVAPSDRWTAYLNGLCVHTLLPWLQTEYCPGARVWTNVAALPSFWAVVNGTALTWGAKRFVLLPTETIDLEEVVVPQEWVDLPSWLADYYLTVQVEPDELWMRISGYTTHARLKTRARYLDTDRTYRLDADDVIGDLAVLWSSLRVCPEETTRVPVAPIPPLPQIQAATLIERLGNPARLTPRLDVPLTLWGALLEHGGWRQRLSERRQGQPESRSLVEWLRSGVSELAQQVGWEQLEQQPTDLGARGDGADEPVALLSRRLRIAGQPYDLQIQAISLEPTATWRFELRSAIPAGKIPTGFVLRLLTEDLQGFDNNQDGAIAPVDVLFVEVAVEPGEGLVWEIEPLPEDCDREILRG